jgi:hypothetical protein
VPSIKVKRISFGQPAFRKLGNAVIDFADRMTVIAGHNGIGKSTIMALVANNSGLSRSQQFKSLFGKAFQGNLFEIVHIDYVGEYMAPKNAGAPLPEPEIQCLINNTDLVRKACSLTGRKNSKRARVVPRNIPLKPITTTDGSITIGRDAKVPLPTIYLGMTRMFPVGEANPKWVQPTHDRTVHPNERKFISEFINDVVVGSATTAGSITSLAIKGTGKMAKHPQYAFDARCVSLGQDSLGTIATALASFHQLKRTWPDYPGGLLIIDEVDAGLHPHAQRKLVQALRKAAKDLDLQIICTTHSTHVVEATHPEGQGDKNAPDAVVYLMDPAMPQVATGFSLQDILGDMNLKPPRPQLKPKRRDLKVYFEDDEAAYFFNRLVPAALKRSLGTQHGVKIKPIPLSVGGSNLVKLSKHDEYFRRVVVVVDGDTSIKGSAQATAHIVRLPSGKDASGKGMSPERTLHGYLLALVDTPGEHPAAWHQLHTQKVTTAQLREHLLTGGWSVDSREAAKNWWNHKLPLLRDWKIVELWLANQPALVQAFHGDLARAVEDVAKRLSA